MEQKKRKKWPYIVLGTLLLLALGGYFVITNLGYYYGIKYYEKGDYGTAVEYLYEYRERVDVEMWEKMAEDQFNKGIQSDYSQDAIYAAMCYNAIEEKRELTNKECFARALSCKVIRDNDYKDYLGRDRSYQYETFLEYLADQNNDMAICLLGDLKIPYNYKEEDEDHEYSQAVEYYNKAFELGKTALPSIKLGFCYLCGFGVQRNIAKAKQYIADAFQENSQEIEGNGHNRQDDFDLEYKTKEYSSEIEAFIKSSQYEKYNIFRTMISETEKWTLYSFLQGGQKNSFNYLEDSKKPNSDGELREVFSTF